MGNQGSREPGTLSNWESLEEMTLTSAWGRRNPFFFPFSFPLSHILPLW